MEVVEAEEETQIMTDEATHSEEESEGEPNSYNEIFGMYIAYHYINRGFKTSFMAKDGR